MIFLEKENKQEYDLLKLWKKYNHLCFNDELVLDFPLKFSNAMKSLLGMVDATVIPGSAKRTYKGYTYDWKVERLVMNNRYELSEEEFESIFVHEMIHVWQFQTGKNPHHGSDFLNKRKEIMDLGIKVSLKDVAAKTIGDHIKIKPIIILMINDDFYAPIKKPFSDIQLADKLNRLVFKEGTVLRVFITKNHYAISTKSYQSIDTFKGAVYKLPKEEFEKIINESEPLFQGKVFHYEEYSDLYKMVITRRKLDIQIPLKNENYLIQKFKELQ